MKLKKPLKSKHNQKIEKIITRANKKYQEFNNFNNKIFIFKNLK